MAKDKKPQGEKRPLTQPQVEAIARRHREKIRKEHASRIEKHRLEAENALQRAHDTRRGFEYRAVYAQIATAHATLALEPAP